MFSIVFLLYAISTLCQLQYTLFSKIKTHRVTYMISVWYSLLTNTSKLHVSALPSLSYTTYVLRYPPHRYTLSGERTQHIKPTQLCQCVFGKKEENKRNGSNTILQMVIPVFNSNLINYPEYSYNSYCMVIEISRLTIGLRYLSHKDSDLLIRILIIN